MQGLCCHAGLELLLSADVYLAVPDTRFVQLEVLLRNYRYGVGTARLSQEIGWGNAQPNLLTGNEFMAEQALGWDMTHLLVD